MLARPAYFLQSKKTSIPSKEDRDLKEKEVGGNLSKALGLQK
jgi:hypothetical protein